MNPIEFKSEKSKEVVLACGKCGRLYPGNPSIAEDCCKPNVCDCGAECRKGYTKCEGCLREGERQRLARIFERAEKVADYDGPVYDPYTERFFTDLGDFEDYYEAEDVIIPRPPYVHVCEIVKPSLDLRTILDNAEEGLELDEQLDVDWEGEAELAKAIKAFNDAQTQDLWYPDMKKVVDLQEST